MKYTHYYLTFMTYLNTTCTATIDKIFGSS